MLQHSTPDSLPALDPTEYSCPALPFLASATLWLGAIFAVSHAGSMEVLSVGASMLLLGAPVWLAGVYTSTLHRQFQLVFFRERGWVYRLLSRRLFIQVFWTFCALVTAFVLLVRFQVYDLLQWAVLAATVPVFALVFRAIHRLLAKELRSDVAATQALVWSRRSCPAIMLLLYVGALASWGDVPVYASLQEAFEAKHGSAAMWNGSALVGHALHWGAYFDGLEAYALGHLGRVDPLWELLAMGAGNLAIFYSVSFALSAFRVTRAGFRQARLAPRSRAAVFATTGVTVFLVAFVYFPLLANLNQWLASSTEPTDVLDEVEEGTTTLVEILGGDPYRPGTAEEIDRARAEALIQIGTETERFRREVDAAFDRLETEAVREYLDWYYSLLAEYGRLGQMLMGNLEEHLAEKWREVIEQEEWFREVDAAREELVSVSEEVWAAYQGRVVEILDRNRLDSEHAPAEITLEASLEAIVQPLLDHQDIITAPTRLGLGGWQVPVLRSGVASRPSSAKRSPQRC